jgi:uncharacterized membrane protein
VKQRSAAYASVPSRHAQDEDYTVRNPIAGFGGFNLFDGLIDHKLLRLHQIRPGAASQLPYDVAWIASSVLILAVGVALLRAGRGRP